MKKFFLYLILTVNSFLLFAQDKFEYTIIGTLPASIHNTYAYLSPVQPDSVNLKDSTLILNGHFIFEGLAKDKPALYNITTEDVNMSGWIVVEPGIIQYTYQDDSIKGYAYARNTGTNDHLTDSIIVPSLILEQKMNELIKKDFSNTTVNPNEWIKQTRSYAKEYYENLISFIIQNSKNTVGEYFFLLYAKTIKDEEVNKILPLFTEEIKQKYYDMQKPVTSEVVITEGQTCINFTGKTPNNEQFILFDLIPAKKLILLDFWASWCTPCIKSMPEIAELYDNYRNKGLEIVGISLDENETFWKKAVEKNNMSWIQIISNKGKSDNIAKMYGVNLIPYTVLLNSEGEIIGVNLRGQELREKLKKTLE
jgi:thiol-disulfide isomerase/thioredoxin